ncbi:MAG TPA: DUF2149 domain-containing protein [Pirellulales bacterium]|nr:DUF2149 domain-containing protein [Pirellulales bacterium]
MHARKRRQWELLGDDDPTAGLANLFDVWMVFAVALLLALASYYHLPELTARSTADNAERKALEATDRQQVQVERVRLTEEQLGGEGRRLGTAYRLKSGEVVYVPDE